jgi:protein-S-isoprenylcysteine O-methyltransferase Ste14
MILQLLRHLLAIVVLPFSVAVAIPFWLARANGVTPSLRSDLPGLAAQASGLIMLGIGLPLFVASLRRFAVEGQGTLAPWDPPMRLVVRGPYRYVRNPMISGIVLVLFGEALVLLSRPHLRWALIFLAINAVYIPLFEEPFLALRFGDEYQEYSRHVPRLFPRWRPWEPEQRSTHSTGV